MKNIYSAVILSLCLSLAWLTAEAEVALDLNPSSPYSVNTGDALDVDVMISGLSGEIVSAYDLDIVFDASVLQAIGVDFGTWLGDALSFEVLESAFLDNSGGVADIAAVSLLSDSDLFALQAPAAGSMTLATLHFTALQDANTSLNFLWGVGNDVKGANNSVIFPVPEPGVLALLSLGTVAAYVRRRRPVTGFR